MERILHTPILFLAFNRPKQTEIVFDSIRKVQPKKLYVAIDGPRANIAGDITARMEVLRIVRNVDWDCEAHYLIHEENLGCSRSGPTAWNWIMKSEDRMIFVEDDGLGTPDAFYFIQEMLEKYKDDERVAFIGAVNYGLKYGSASYFFSRCPAATYFMGTWKRVMKHYDYELISWRNNITPLIIKRNSISNKEYLLRKRYFDKYVHSIKSGNRNNTYDVQLSYLSYAFNMWSIHPNNNMVSNIGLDGGANNFVNVKSSFYKEYANRATQPLKNIVYTEDVIVDKEFEKIFFKKRVLYNKNWFLIFGKAIFLQYFGKLYKKYFKPLRWDR